jgi:hypothetical protein
VAISAALKYAAAPGIPNKAADTPARFNTLLREHFGLIVFSSFILPSCLFQMLPKNNNVPRSRW